MNRAWLLLVVLAVLFVFGAGGSARADFIAGIGPVTVATGTVTFEVDMSVRLCEGLMVIGDVVSVPGDFGDPQWTPGTDILTDGDGDSVYTLTKDIAEGPINYKFHDGNDWENDPNHMYTVVAGISQTIPVVYFNGDAVCEPPTIEVPVTFQVNMSVKIAEGSFDPGAGEWVGARGDFNGWAPGDTLTDPDADEIYTGTMMLMEGSAYGYKFVIRNDDATDTWEDNIGGNRMYTVPTGGGTIPVVYFDGDDVISVPVVQNILLKTGLQAYSNMGWFNPSLGDSVQVRGAFNNWVGDVCEDPLSILEYEYLEQNFAGFSGDNFPYKFYIDFDPATAPTRFPGWDVTTQDGYNYEHPAERGDGNRIFVLPNVQGNVAPEVYYYSDINPFGVLNSPDTVNVTFTADMGPAVAGGFDASTDTVKIVWEDALWRSIQVLHQGAFPQVWIMNRVGSTNMFTLSFRVEGTTHYNMQYHLRYTKPDGTGLTEGGGLGTQCPFRSRFIQPLGENSFPTSYVAPVDVWTLLAPLVCEGAYFNPSTDVAQEPQLGQPVTYKLTQNYPNPFNPATRIKYSIPQRSQVTLRIYNVLGQEVATLVNEIQEQGNYVALFEANKLATGVYMYKLEAGKFSETKKMLLMK